MSFQSFSNLKGSFSLLGPLQLMEQNGREWNLELYLHFVVGEMLSVGIAIPTGGSWFLEIR